MTDTTDDPIAWLERCRDFAGSTPHARAMAARILERLRPAGALDRDELNPNHPVTRELHNHWHKIAAILLMKLRADERHQELEITDQDVRDLEEMLGPNAAVVADTRGNRLVLRIVDAAEAATLAREAGGLRS